MKLSDILIPQNDKNYEIKIRNDAPKIGLNPGSIPLQDNEIGFITLKSNNNYIYIYHFLVNNFETDNLTVDEILNLEINLPDLKEQDRRVKALEHPVSSHRSADMGIAYLSETAHYEIDMIKTNTSSTKYKFSDICDITDKEQLIISKLDAYGCEGLWIDIKDENMKNPNIDKQYLSLYLYLDIIRLKNEKFDKDMVISIAPDQKKFIDEVLNILNKCDKWESEFWNSEATIKSIVSPV